MYDSLVHVEKQQCTVSTELLHPLLAGLISSFEAAASQLSIADDHWVSPSGDTKVIKYGCSAAVMSVLDQHVEQTISEYQVIYRSRSIYCWQEFMWPHLRDHNLSAQPERVSLPSDCVDELMGYHRLHDTPWWRRYRQCSLSNRAIEIDKISVVA